MRTKVLVLSLFITAIASAHDEHAGKPIIITGKVVDTGCYMGHDSKGEAHANCARACAKAGVPLAILDDHGTLYMPIAVEHKEQNTKLVPYIEKRVKVTSTALDKGGLKGVAIKTVEAVP
jgi:hypothetical protein